MSILFIPLILTDFYRSSCTTISLKNTRRKDSRCEQCWQNLSTPLHLMKKVIKQRYSQKRYQSNGASSVLAFLKSYLYSKITCERASIHLQRNYMLIFLNNALCTKESGDFDWKSLVTLKRKQRIVQMWKMWLG